MLFTSTIAAAVLAFCATGILAAPLPQLAGTGAAAGSILTDTDNGVGYGVQNAENNLAGNVDTAKKAAAVPATPKVARQLAGTGAAANSILTDTDNGVGYGVQNAENKIAGNVDTAKKAAAVPATPKVARQLAGTGAAADSILTDTDNGVGYGVENAEDNTAATISSVTGTSSGGDPPPPPPPPPKKNPRSRRQLDKIANGAGAISKAAGIGATTDSIVAVADSDDGTTTSGQADAGSKVGSTEESTLESAGSAVPKRQLDKIANGAGAVSGAAGAGAVTAPVVAAADDVDGTTTSGQADAGAKIGSTEESTLESAGSAVSKRQLDKIANGAGAVSGAAGTGAVTAPVVAAADSVDGTTTSGQADAGAKVGSTEESTLESAGNAVPK